MPSTEHRARRAVENICEGAPCERQFADGLLGENGKGVVLLEHAQMAGSRYAETVADTERTYGSENGLRCAEREKLSQKRRVCVI